MDCRGTERRKYIVENYYVQPIAHLKLLNGKIVHSDAGRDISDSYFIFRCIDKKSGKSDIIQCGLPTAKELCNRIRKQVPPIYNPLHVTGTAGTAKGGSKKPQIKWNPTRQQLYDATMLLIIAWDAVPNTPLYDIKEELETYIRCEPYMSRIKAVNTMLKNSNTTMRNILNKLALKNDIKEYHFDLLIDKLNAAEIEQHFE